MPKLKSRLTRGEFQALSATRYRGAESLLHSGEHDGAIYLAGYAIECGLKACIARQTQQYEFPDLDTVRASYTHDLDQRVGVAGLRAALNAKLNEPVFSRDWALVGQWHEDDRYRSGASPVEARDFLAAVGRVLEWIRQHW